MKSLTSFGTYGKIHAARSGKSEKVRLYHRAWDGIDQPDYTDIALLSADEARWLAQQLFEAAESIDGKSKKDRTAAKVAANTKKIAEEAKRAAME